MSKDNQIEEMAKVIEITKQIARDAHCGYPSPRMIASDLYDKGYRERSEVAREIFEEMWEMFIPEKSAAGCAYYFDMYELAELKKKYTEGNNG